MLEWYNSWSDVQAEDLDQVSKHLGTGALSVVSGGLLARFEKAFAKFAGASYGVAFHNGTGAIHSALKACGVGPGTDVLMGDYGFHGMAAAVLATGARVVPVDSCPESLCLDPQDLARARTKQTKAVLVHNPWGFPADYLRIREAAPGLPLISDASHAHGATYEGRPLGQWADITCYSLGHQKLISGGELGCAVTDSVELRDRMLVQGHVNRVPRDLKTEFWTGNAVGLKMRPHPAALILASAQLKRYPEKLKLLRETCSTLEERFRELDLRPQSASYQHQRVWWKIVLRACPTSSRSAVEEVEKSLRACGVPLESNHYHPTLQHQDIFTWPPFQGQLLPRPCPRTQETVDRLLTLPAPVRLPNMELSIPDTSEKEPRG